MVPDQLPSLPLVICLCEDLEPLREVAERHCVRLIKAESVRELLELLDKNATTGIVLDVIGLMRASSHEKHVLNSFIEAFPVLHVNMPRCGGTVTLKTLVDPDVFFGCQCRDFQARTLRSNVRLPLHMPLLISAKNDPEMAHPIRTCSLDVSEGGMFILLCEGLATEEWVWLQLVDLPSDDLILAHIRWRRLWGAGLTLPGLGVKFAHISAEQHGTLCRRFLLRENFSSPDIEDIEEALEAVMREAKR